MTSPAHSQSRAGQLRRSARRMVARKRPARRMGCSSCRPRWSIGLKGAWQRATALATDAAHRVTGSSALSTP